MAADKCQVRLLVRAMNRLMLLRAVLRVCNGTGRYWKHDNTEVQYMGCECLDMMQCRYNYYLCDAQA
jgi:hypothetical protein